MRYAHKGKFGLTFKQIKDRYPNVSFPENGKITHDGVVTYNETPRPDYDQITQGIREISPADGLQRWEVFPLPQEQIDANRQAELNQLRRNIERKAQQRLDDFAQTRNYENILSAASYDGDPDPVFDAEGKRAKAMRSETWRVLTGIMNDVLSGNRDIPQSFEEIEPELPELKWPEV